MAMVVKNNMGATRTLNTLNKNSSALQKSLAKVSSGMKINSAQDDASGYAISERMRVQIRSLDQANQNTQNASSLMKTAEGAVSSTVEILKSLKEKAVNAATDTNTDADRVTIQKELDQFIDQIDDNALTTFNGKYLVDGSKSQSGVAVSTAMTNQSLGLKDTDGADLGSSTKLTKLTNRNGESLEISSADYVTASFVKNGRTYTTKYSVKNTTLEDIFKKLNAITDEEGKAVNAFGGAGSVEQDTPCAPDAAFADLQAANTAFKSAFTSLTNWNTKGAGEQADMKAWADSFMASNKYEKAQKASTSSGYPTGTYSQWWLSNQSGVLNNAVSAWNTAVDTYNNSFPTTSTSTSTKDVPLVARDSKVGTNAFGDAVYTANGETGLTVTAATKGIRGQISGLTISITDSEGNVKKSANAALDDFKTTIYAKNDSSDNEMTFQVGAKANQSITVGLDDMRSEALGLKGSDGSKVSVATQAKANAAVAVFDNAIQKALDQQATIGAIEARLEYTSQNLTTSSENVQAAESTIRDADMAKEMTEYTKNNVLLQAAQSMLAQANQNSSAVLSLLQ